MIEAGRHRKTTSAPRLAAAFLGVVLATLAAFYVVSLATAMVDPARYRKVIAEAVATGTLAQTRRLPFGGEAAPIYNFNDCLILSMLVLPQDPNPLLRALSPIVPADPTPWSGEVQQGYPPYVQCRDLAAAMASTTAMPTNAYHRYLHGDWVLAKALLAFLPLSTACNVIAVFLALLLLAPAALAGRRLIAGGADRPRERAYFALSLCLFAFSALPVFAWSFSFAPSDIVLAAMVLFFYLRPPSSLSDQGLVVAAALFGTLTALFEFLTGAAPSGLMALVAVIAFDDAASARQMLRRLLLAAIIFGAAIALSFAVKMAAVAAIWGVSELGVFGRQVGAHMSAGGWDIAPDNAERLSRFGISVESIRNSVVLSYAYALSKIVYFTQSIGFGSIALGAILAVALPLGLAGFSIFALLRARNEVTRLRIASVLAGCLVMPAWYLAFIHHTIVHAHFMFRPMVWPLALLTALLAWGMTGKARQGAKDRKPFSALTHEPGRQRNMA